MAKKAKIDICYFSRKDYEIHFYFWRFQFAPPLLTLVRPCWPSLVASLVSVSRSHGSPSTGGGAKGDPRAVLAILTVVGRVGAHAKVADVVVGSAREALELPIARETTQKLEWSP